MAAGFRSVQEDERSVSNAKEPISHADADVDGEAPKRRGPKPDSKPAATKRQEMNRLAQRYTFPLRWL